MWPASGPGVGWSLMPDDVVFQPPPSCPPARDSSPNTQLVACKFTSQVCGCYRSRGPPQGRIRGRAGSWGVLSDRGVTLRCSLLSHSGAP